MHKSMQTWSRGSVVFQTKFQNEEDMYLNDFDPGIIIGTSVA